MSLKQKFQNTERKLTLLKRFNKISNQDELDSRNRNNEVTWKSRISEQAEDSHKDKEWHPLKSTRKKQRDN